uniref:Concentrative nucleoside transporter, CNT family n=1 Tax=Candidatus Kentrum sp. TUN TaxID=2126343 RepID=A0A450ZC38_9GAMM|nr:MAG: concentrative nucleoside transporter, CNT family [Candidatus Kentron sp. TUN]VFK52593.1 MAG: concentrative nucleoside transporter, CNT family [Candidatus Kentron sp. TUN]VFK53091.1 MAG: concentrative nucleoside transporter, CNT family [Candidatus Kentron sp. TUN]
MIFQSLFGLVFLVFICWLLSERRWIVDWRIPIAGLALQFVLAFALIKLPVLQDFFVLLNQALSSLQEATRAGTSLVFGFVGGGEVPYEERAGGSSFILAFQALPLVLVMSALSALLFYWRVLPLVVRFFSLVLQKTLGVGGALGLGAAANIFVGMVEAPLVIRPYLSRLSRAELFALMTCGMATVAGTVMVLYAAILSSVLPNAMGHILMASLISAPAAIMVARIMVPEIEKEATEGDLVIPQPATSAMDAVTKGTLDGLRLLLNIVAILIVFVALVSLVNQVLDGLGSLDLQELLGFVMVPVVWLMGIPWEEAQSAGMLMGTKTVLNEFLAYLEMSALPAGTLSERSVLIMSYALCGFANFGSLGITIAGMSTMAPDRYREIVGLGMKSIVSGTLATCLTGAVVGIVTLA